MIHIEHLENTVKKSQCDDYEIYLRAVEATSFEVKDQQLECFTTSQSWGVSLRILKDGRLGFSYATQCTADALEQVVSIAVSSARYASPDECNGFPQPPPLLPQAMGFDSSLPSIPVEEKIEMLKGIEHEARSFDKRISRVRKASYQEQRASEQLITSRGTRLKDEDTLITCALAVVAEDKGDSQSGWDFTFSRFYAGLQTSSLAASAASKAIALLGARPIPSFRGPVILDRCVAQQFLGILAHSFLADAVQKNRSLFNGKMNSAVCSDQVNITDDGLYPGGMASRIFDGEGVSSQTTPLIENGVLNNYLYDTHCARKDRTKSTGNSSRPSLKTPPRIGSTNLYLHNGECTLAGMIGKLSRGLLITGVLGMHTANPISGDFSLGVDGLLIQNGATTAPVKGMALAGNIMSLYSDIVCIGNDLRFYGTVGSPSILVAEMDICGN